MASLMSSSLLAIKLREDDDSIAPKLGSTTNGKVDEVLNNSRYSQDAANGVVPANSILDLDDTLGNYIGKQPEKENMHVSGYHGGDEDEIMDKVFNKLCVPALDSTNNKTGQKLLMKKAGKRAAEILLEATHKLKFADVEPYVSRNFESAWEAFDQNKEGWIRYEESHTFIRHFFGRLNKFAVAPGSISDLTTGAQTYPLSIPAEKTPVSQV